jgi:hypothetical protein
MSFRPYSSFDSTKILFSNVNPFINFSFKSNKPDKITLSQVTVFSAFLYLLYLSANLTSLFRASLSRDPLCLSLSGTFALSMSLSEECLEKSPRFFEPDEAARVLLIIENGCRSHNAK